MWFKNQWKEMQISYPVPRFTYKNEIRYHRDKELCYQFLYVVQIAYLFYISIIFLIKTELLTVLSISKGVHTLLQCSISHRFTRDKSKYLQNRGIHYILTRSHSFQCSPNEYFPYTHSFPPQIEKEECSGSNYLYHRHACQFKVKWRV